MLCRTGLGMEDPSGTDLLPVDANSHDASQFLMRPSLSFAKNESVSRNEGLTQQDRWRCIGALEQRDQIDLRSFVLVLSDGTPAGLSFGAILLKARCKVTQGLMRF